MRLLLDGAEMNSGALFQHLLWWLGTGSFIYLAKRNGLMLCKENL